MQIHSIINHNFCQEKSKDPKRDGIAKGAVREPPLPAIRLIENADAEMTLL